MNQNSLFLILAAPATAWVCGMGLFKTLLAMVFMHRYLPSGEFAGPLGELFAQDWFFYGACVMGAVELIVDFVPRLDIAWHRWNGHLRLVAAAVLTWALLAEEEVSARIMMAIVGVMLALTAYVATTSARRAAMRAGTEGFVSPIASVTEDCMVAATLFPLTQLPPLTLLMVFFMMMGALMIIYMVRREARETFGWLFAGRWVRPEKRDTSGGND